MIDKIFNFQGKTILVLGASSGVGRCVAKLCSDYGAILVLNGRNGIRLRETLDLLSKKNHIIFEKDINDSDFESSLRDISSQIQITGIFFAIGIHKFTPIRVTDSNTIHEIMNTNFISAFKIIKFIAKIANKNSQISAVFMSSTASISSDIGINIYSASKAALNSLVRSSAKELLTKMARLNLISAGFINTEMFDNILSQLPEERHKEILTKYPLGIGKPEDVAYLALYLLSDASGWMTGANIILDGGSSL